MVTTRPAPTSVLGPELSAPLNTSDHRVPNARFKARKIFVGGHPTSVRLEPQSWGWLRIIAAECGMTAKKFIECIRIAHPNDPLSSTLRVQITNYFYSQSPRTGFVDSESKFAFRIERPRKSRKRKQSP